MKVCKNAISLSKMLAFLRFFSLNWGMFIYSKFL